MTVELRQIDRSNAAAIEVVEARKPAEIAAAADLMRAFVDWQHIRHAEHRERLGLRTEHVVVRHVTPRLPEAE